MELIQGEYRDAFLEEADELLSRLSMDLLSYEKKSDTDSINDIFRSVHTLKSSAAAVGLAGLSSFIHEMENLIQALRDERLLPSRNVMNLLFRCFDLITGVIGSAAKGRRSEENLSKAIEDIRSLSPEDESAEKKSSSYIVPSVSLDLLDLGRIREGLAAGKSILELTVFIDPSAQMKFLKATIITMNLSRLGDVIKTFQDSPDLSGNVFRILISTDAPRNELVRSCNIDQIIKVLFRDLTLGKKNGKTAVKFSQAGEAVLGKEESVNTSEPSFPLAVPAVTKAAVLPSSLSDSVKVSAEKMEEVLNKAEKLSATGAELSDLYGKLEASASDRAVLADVKAVMNRITDAAAELKEGILSWQTVSAEKIFSGFFRVVRDLSRETGREINLALKGEMTSVNKSAADQLPSILVHLVRNAADHGIEDPAERRRSGKPEAGNITLEAAKENSMLVIKVSDDGRGMDPDKIRARAEQLNVKNAGSMNETSLLNLIFEPGFSTSGKVSEISGRGEGLDYVKHAVEGLNGDISISTEKGKGTCFTVTLPESSAGRSGFGRFLPAYTTTSASKDYVFSVPRSTVRL